MERSPDQRGFWPGPLRHVHEPWRLGAISPLLWVVLVGLDIPYFLGRWRGGAVRHFHLAVPTVEERPKPGLHALQRGSVLGEQYAAPGDSVRHTVGHGLSAVIAADQRRRNHDCPTVLRPSKRAADAGSGLPYGRGPADTVAQSRDGQRPKNTTATHNWRPGHRGYFGRTRTAQGIRPNWFRVGDFRDYRNPDGMVPRDAFPSSQLRRELCRGVPAADHGQPSALRRLHRPPVGGNGDIGYRWHIVLQHAS